MEYVFLLLLLLSLCGLMVGLVRPTILNRFIGRDLSKRQHVLTYALLGFISFMGVGLTAPDLETLPSLPASNLVEGQSPTASDQEPATVETIEISEAAPVTPELRGEEARDLYEVTRVVDGDTIEVQINGKAKTVRYIGVNTPETVHPSKPVECFGREASDKNKALVAGKQVRLVKDVSDTDRYGRLLRYVYVGEVFVNETLVREGYANASSYPPDVVFNELFRTAEAEARTNKRGLWGDACSEVTVAPATSLTPASSASGAGQCTIKGNINSEDEKIYHVAGCQSYTKTVIDESKGERWFCSEAEALEAGWRKALNC